MAFDVRVEPQAQELADHLGVRIFVADIIYHLFDQFMAHREERKKQKQEEFKYKTKTYSKDLSHFYVGDNCSTHFGRSLLHL